MGVGENAERSTGQEYARRNWQEQSFRDLKSGGWKWGQSCVCLPQHTANLPPILTFAYAWCSLSVVRAWRRAALNRSSGDPTVRAGWSLFREGLHYFVEALQRHTICLGLVFIPDRRFT